MQVPTVRVPIWQHEIGCCATRQPASAILRRSDAPTRHQRSAPLALGPYKPQSRTSERTIGAKAEKGGSHAQEKTLRRERCC